MAKQNDVDGLESFIEYYDTMKACVTGDKIRVKAFFLGIAYGLNLADYISGDCLDRCLDYINKKEN